MNEQHWPTLLVYSREMALLELTISFANTCINTGVEGAGWGGPRARVDGSREVESGTACCGTTKAASGWGAQQCRMAVDNGGGGGGDVKCSKVYVPSCSL